MLYPSYIPQVSFTTFEDFDAEVPWISRTEARQECFMADEVMDYTYGAGRGIRTYTSIPYIPRVAGWRTSLNSHTGLNYNVCFLNRYQDEKQHLGWHADDSPGMDHDHPIAVISYGEPREIWWRTPNQKGVIPDDQKQVLGHGSLFIMPPGFQRAYQHRIPKGDRKMGPRLSLTFRHYKKE